MLLSDKDSFGSGKWQDFLNQIAFLKENNISVESVKDLLEEYKKKAEQGMQEAQKLSAMFPKCPNCGTVLQLLPVNNSPATQTGDNSKSVLICSKCHYDEFSNKTVKEQTEEIRKKAQNRHARLDPASIK